MNCCGQTFRTLSAFLGHALVAHPDAIYDEVVGSVNETGSPA